MSELPELPDKEVYNDWHSYATTTVLLDTASLVAMSNFHFADTFRIFGVLTPQQNRNLGVKLAPKVFALLGQPHKRRRVERKS